MSSIRYDREFFKRNDMLVGLDVAEGLYTLICCDRGNDHEMWEVEEASGKWQESESGCSPRAGRPSKVLIAGGRPRAKRLPRLCVIASEAPPVTA